MAKPTNLVAAGPSVSFEFFPPKTEEGRVQLDRCLDELSVVDPTFVSVTYGAGGTTGDLTRDLVVEINDERPFPAMPHLTCIGHTRVDLEAMLDDYAKSGIHNILALAGDPPADGTRANGDFTYASELVDLVRSRGDFSIAVAAFPEGHPRSASLAEDRRRLADKLARADVGITQFFFRAEDYFAMVDDLAALGCDTPVLPGIMPMLNPDVVRRFATMNGAFFPDDLANRITAASESDRMAIAVEAAGALCEELLAGGVPGLHLYCLNRSSASLAILGNLALGGH